MTLFCPAGIFDLLKKLSPCLFDHKQGDKCSDISSKTPKIDMRLT